MCDLLGWLARRFEAAGASATDGDVRTRFVHELVERIGVGTDAAEQIVDYLCTAHAALGALPDRDTVVFERFFDESGGMQLVIHSRFGSRLNRAWGLALRKRFCRKFNFELQAAATEDAIVLSLSEAHSFALDEVARYLSPETVRDVLTQALLDAPMFDVRWRWNANVSLAIPRFRGGAKVPPNIQRMQAEDLVAAVFPDQIACAENLAGPRAIPDHPLVEQTIADALTEAMDIDGLETLVRRLGDGDTPGRRPRPHRALPARGGSPRRPSLRVPRRCAARGAPGAGGDDAPRTRSGLRRRHRTARCGRDRPGLRRGMA